MDDTHCNRRYFCSLMIANRRKFFGMNVFLFCNLAEKNLAAFCMCCVSTQFSCKTHDPLGGAFPSCLFTSLAQKKPLGYCLEENEAMLTRVFSAVMSKPQTQTASVSASISDLFSGRKQTRWMFHVGVDSSPKTSSSKAKATKPKISCYTPTEKST